MICSGPAVLTGSCTICSSPEVGGCLALLRRDEMIAYLVYDLILLLISPVLLGCHLFRSRRRGRPAAIAERLGRILPEEKVRAGDVTTLWVHAVSVGETMAVRPLLKELKKRYPATRIILSNITETGRSVALRLGEADRCIYFPFDYGFAVSRSLDAIRPSLIIIVETEIWPNFLRQANRRRIPVILANGRISDRSFGRYLRFRPFFRRILGDFSAFCMQTGDDARRIIAMGARQAKVHVAGNLKFDNLPIHKDGGGKAASRRNYHISEKCTVIVAASTHAGEEDAFLEACRDLLMSGQPIILVVVPRHPERAEAAASLLSQSGITAIRRTELDDSMGELSPGTALLVDTVGELMKIFAVSDLAFVGGSLQPVGGHNLLEPASLGVPIIFGPHMENFREIADLVLSYGAGVQVADVEGLAAAVRRLLGDPALREEMGENGLRLLRENGGATFRHMEVITQFMQRETADGVG